jgi:putative transposase
VSASNVETVKEYIRRQVEHHKKISFEDQLRTFLKKHGVAFDERYLWD